MTTSFLFTFAIASFVIGSPVAGAVALVIASIRMAAAKSRRNEK